MEEKKTYSVVGTVTIGTDEYRDLIEGLCEAKKETDKVRDMWLGEYNKARKLEPELKELSAKYGRLHEFVHTEDIAPRYKLWCLEQQREA